MKRIIVILGVFFFLYVDPALGEPLQTKQILRSDLGEMTNPETGKTEHNYGDDQEISSVVIARSDPSCLTLTAKSSKGDSKAYSVDCGSPAKAKLLEEMIQSKTSYRITYPDAPTSASYMSILKAITLGPDDDQPTSKMKIQEISDPKSERNLDELLTRKDEVENYHYPWWRPDKRALDHLLGVHQAAKEQKSMNDRRLTKLPPVIRTTRGEASEENSAGNATAKNPNQQQ